MSNQLEPREVAQWLVGTGATSDENFAETFAYMSKIILEDDDNPLQKEDMAFNIGCLMDRLGEFLEEIINDPSCDSGAWWKQEQ